MIRGKNSTFEVAINWTLYLKKPPSRSTGSTQLKSCRSDALPSHPYPTRTTSERMNAWTNAATLTWCFEQLQRGCWRWDNKAAVPQSLFSSAAGGGRTAGNRWTCINYASNTYMPCSFPRRKCCKCFRATSVKQCWNRVTKTSTDCDN